LAFLAVGWLVVIDVANGVSAGPTSLAGLLSMASVVVMVFVWLSRGLGAYDQAGFAEPGRSPVPFALTLFAVWAVATIPLHPSSEGIQNVTVYLGFVLGIAVTGRLCSAAATDRLLDHLQKAGWFVGLLYLASVLASGLGASGVYDARAFALAALVLLGVAVARGRSRLLPLLLLLDVVLSLSRTAALMSILIVAVGLAVRSTSRGRALRVLVLLAVGVAAAWFAFTRFAPLRDRFEGGDQAFRYGGTQFNVSGRADLWSFTLQDSRHHWWFGGGPGSADQAVLNHFVTVSHPHNDYLRVLHDFGVVGLVVFVIGFVTLMVRTWKLGRTTGRPIHWAAFLALVGVAGTAFTDNVVVYAFVMVPLGVLVGASLSESPVAEPRSVRHQPRQAATPSL
jgi:O-antigen ligase